MTPVERIAVEAIALLPGMPDLAKRFLFAVLSASSKAERTTSLERGALWATALMGVPEDAKRLLLALVEASKLGPSRYVPRRLRRLVLERDGLVCGICGEPVARPDVHIDHIRPLSRGGPTVARNLRVSHARCNTRRGNRVDA